MTQSWYFKRLRMNATVLLTFWVLVLRRCGAEIARTPLIPMRVSGFSLLPDFESILRSDFLCGQSLPRKIG